MNISSDLAVGGSLPVFELPPITRTTLALFAGGSGDYNPLHIDTDFAREAAGMSDVIGQGMLSMALLGSYLTRIVSQSRIRDFQVRFQGMTHIGDVLRCSGSILGHSGDGADRTASLQLSVHNQNDEPILVGEAVVSRGE